jgi:hypothetical protein
MDPRLRDPRSVAALGEKIYAERYREEFEQLYLGQFVVIDVTTEEAYRGITPEEAINAARQHAPQGVFHMIRVGEPGAFRVSYTARVAGRSRLPT